MSSVATIEPGTGVLHLPLQLPLHYGGTLTAAQLGFEITGRVGAPLVVVLGGISADRHVSSNCTNSAPGWWEAQVGSGRAIDTQRFRVVGIDWIGGAGASTGPQLGARFPLVTSHDQASVLALLIDELQVPAIARIIGSSFGGMVGLAFAQRFPHRIRALTVISAAHQSHPLAAGWRSIQRRIVKLGIGHGVAAAREALAIARGLAMTTYRCAEELEERFGSAPEIPDDVGRLPIESWLEAHGTDFAARYPPEAFLALSWALDLHRVRPETITAPTTVVAASSDQLVPVAQSRELRSRLAGPARLVEIATKFGHDAFLKEAVAIAAILREDLAEVAS